jgi:16S rRNA (cytosine967-C5)-methyltransferase
MADKFRWRLYQQLLSYYQGELKEDYFEDSPEQRLYRKIYFETFRHLGFIEKTLSAFYKTTPNVDARASMAVGACQILFMDDVPDYAAVNESVSMVPMGRRKFVNAILRNIGRQKEQILKGYDVKQDFPEWFVKRWEKRLGKDLETFLKDLNSKPSFYSVDPDSYEIEKVEEKSDGYIMDYASFQVARIAGDCMPMSVIDCCAAPGGKTFSLSGKYPDAKIFSVEKNPDRFDVLKKNVSRLGLGNVECVNSDILEMDTEAKFDLVLLDAPCSALGTIKRHPEVRWLRDEQEIGRNAKRQFEMLKKVSKMMAEGGRLIYSVCSLEPEETTMNIERFLRKNPKFRLVKPECDEKFIDGDYFVSIPYRTDSDGFFAAVLTK